MSTETSNHQEQHFLKLGESLTVNDQSTGRSIRVTAVPADMPDKAATKLWRVTGILATILIGWPLIGAAFFGIVAFVVWLIGYISGAVR